MIFKEKILISIAFSVTPLFDLGKKYVIKLSLRDKFITNPSYTDNVFWI